MTTYKGEILVMFQMLQMGIKISQLTGYLRFHVAIHKRNPVELEVEHKLSPVVQ